MNVHFYLNLFVKLFLLPKYSLNVFTKNQQILDGARWSDLYEFLLIYL
jgi:hypothetical protein